MIVATLDQVETLADSLSAVDQLRLIQRLAPKIASVMSQSEPQSIDKQTDPTEDTWKRFFAIGDAIAKGDSDELPTLTSTLQAMRR